MKLKILAAALALLMLLSACGRKKNNYKYNIPGYTGDTEYSSGEEEQDKETEQESGKLVCVTKKKYLVNDDETYNAEYPVYFEKYYYDENGNLVREEEYDYDTDRYQTVVRYTTYEYDENGRCVHECSYDDDVVDTYYEYDAAGNQVSKIYYTNGNRSDEYHWEYDDHGSVIASYEYDNEPEYIVEYEYNDDGTVRSKTGHETKYGHQSGYVEYAYDENGRLVREDVTSWGEYSGYWEYVYDDYGVLIEVHRYDEYGFENDENRELYYTEYDEAGNQITYAELYTTGTEKGTPRYTYRRTFDSEGNVTEERKYNYKGKPDGLFVYEYAPLSEAIWQG